MAREKVRLMVARAIDNPTGLILWSLSRWFMACIYMGNLYSHSMQQLVADASTGVSSDYWCAEPLQSFKHVQFQLPQNEI